MDLYKSEKYFELDFDNVIPVPLLFKKAKPRKLIEGFPISLSASPFRNLNILSPVSSKVSTMASYIVLNVGVKTGELLVDGLTDGVVFR